MQTDIIEIKKAVALEIYKKADYNQKQVIKELLGETFFKNITDKIKTFEDACTELNISPEDVLHIAHSDYIKKDIDSINAYTKLIIIIRALNEGWVPDWRNEDQYKYFPWFDMSSGSELVSDGYSSWFTSSLAGSRLCFRDRETAKYAGETFKDLYEEYFLIK